MFSSRIVMRPRSPVVLLLFCLLLTVGFSAFGTAQVETQVEYTIQIRADGSAIFNARQVGTAIPVSPDVFAKFRSNVTSLVHSAVQVTGRNMSAANFKYTAEVSDRLVVVRYQFEWSNFSRIEPSRIVVGDVFEVPDFFSRLTGDGELYLTYSLSYDVQDVSPEPDERNDTLQRLGWLGTVVFETGEPQVVLEEIPASFGAWQFLSQNAVSLVVAASAVLAIFVAYFTLALRRKNRKGDARKLKTLDPFEIESDEEKITRLLESSGRGVRQSEIVDGCGFSKAKTSQLLTSLEAKGVIKRYKRGRDKVVVLVESDRSSR